MRASPDETLLLLRKWQQKSEIRCNVVYGEPPVLVASFSCKLSEISRDRFLCLGANDTKLLLTPRGATCEYLEAADIPEQERAFVGEVAEAIFSFKLSDQLSVILFIKNEKYSGTLPAK